LKSNSKDSHLETLFFFGAGASVPAGINDVKGLVNDFTEWLKSNSKTDESERIEKIIAILEKWLAEQKDTEGQQINRKVDIELILETVEKLENANKDIFRKFFENEKSILSEFKSDKRHSKDLKQFIRTKCFVAESKVEYLSPLLATHLLQLNSFRFVPTLGMMTPSFPPHIELQFDEIGNITSKTLSEYLEQTIIPIVLYTYNLLYDLIYAIIYCVQSTNV
jgi:hypothetical protein